ncbi:MAG: hypothetical protein MUC41_11595 [Syntrophobacteraceae bacterium]|jgi:hypothetical protein|nr:hypothetical protein [Syntrophobacteraceae bacterium]
MESSVESQSARKTWLVIIGLLMLILAKGMFTFWLVGDLGQPTWDYRPVPDVPGESPYAIYAPMPHPQHVRGDKGE